jgi:sulfotransferase family protein
MPRSGTTLVEQIIASHPNAYGAGELPHLGRVTGTFGVVSKKFLVDTDRALGLEKKKAQELAQLYLERLSQSAGKALRITDKAPLNGRFLGVAALLFPCAKILYCKRNPLDTCVSIFMQKFQAGHNYSNDLKMLGQFHRAYAGLMDHWTRLFPQAILELNYEESVDQFELQARRIIAHIGLEWHDACLNFRSTERPILTASKWQVRQPIYRTSVERWRRYAKHLGPLIEGLGDIAADSVPP